MSAQEGDEEAEDSTIGVCQLTADGIKSKATAGPELDFVTSYQGKYKTMKRTLAPATEEREKLNKTRSTVREWEWGLYAPECRVNVDQIPFNLDQQRKCGYFAAGDVKKVVSGPTGSEKRFGTVQMCVHAGTKHFKQAQLALIFFGKGLATNHHGRNLCLGNVEPYVRTQPAHTYKYVSKNIEMRISTAHFTYARWNPSLRTYIRF